MKEMITSEFLGREKGNNRWTYKFANLQNPKDLTKPIKISVFEPNPPELKEGEEYTFEVENVPMKEDNSKFHHNLTRNAIGKYNIYLSNPILPAMEGKEPEKVGKIEEKANLTAQKIEQIHKQITENPDSIEIGNPSKGGAVKIYGDFSKPEAFAEKIRNAKTVRAEAQKELGG